MTDIKRRKFVTLLGAGATVVPVSALVASLPSHAQDTTLLDPASTEAQNVQYVEVAADSSKICGNCALYTGVEGEEEGPCLLFQTPGTVVKAAGHCSAWAPKG